MRRQPSEQCSDSTGNETSDGRADGQSTRRSVLRTAGAVTAAAAGLGLVGSASAGGQYDDVVNVVDDIGADPTGEEPINDALDDAVDDDTKVVFPDGTYRIADNGFHRWDFGSGVAGERVSNVAFVGRGDATLLAGPDIDNYILAIWGDDVRIEGFRIDETAEDTAVGLSHECTDRLVLRDITFEGVSDTFGTTKIGPAVTDPDGTALVEDVHITDGAVGYSRHTGLWTFPEHAGELLIRRCSFEGLSDNAIYASPVGMDGRGGQGTVGVENCFFRNNNVSSIRLGSPGSYAKNCTVVFDGYIPEYDEWGAVTARAGWFWYDFEGTLKNIDVVSEHEAGHGFLAYPDHGGAIELKNCRVELDEGNEAVDFTAGTGDVTLRNTSVSGDVDGTAAVRIADRTLDATNVWLQQTGEDRDGFAFENATATIERALIDVTGEAIVADEDSDVTTRHVRSNGNAPPAQSHHPVEQ